MSASALRQSPAAYAARAAVAKQVVALYRQICRDVPKVLTMYQVEGFTVADARRAVLLNHFRSKAKIADPRMIERLLAKARQEVEEVLQQWKQKGHIQLLLAPPADGFAEDPMLLDGDEFHKLCARPRARAAGRAGAGNGPRGGGARAAHAYRTPLSTPDPPPPPPPGLSRARSTRTWFG